MNSSKGYFLLENETLLCVFLSASNKIIEKDKNKSGWNKIFLVLKKYFDVLYKSDLVKSLQPDIAQGNEGVSVVFGSLPPEDSLKLLLARSPLVFGQMEVAN